MRAGEIEHGERIADRAEAVWNWASPAGQRRAERRAALISQGAGLHEGMSVLELGCGTGLFTEQFARSGCSLTAVDVSPALLEQAAARPCLHGVRIMLDDAEGLSFDDASFDAVIGSSILHHLDLQTALCEIHRVLKPGGRLSFAEPNLLNPQIALQRSVPLFRRWAGESPEETAYVRWSLADALHHGGFDNVSIQPFDFLHPATPPRLIRVVKKLGTALEWLPVIREIAGSLIITATRAAGNGPSGRAKGVEGVEGVVRGIGEGSAPSELLP